MTVLVLGAMLEVEVVGLSREGERRFGGAVAVLSVMVAPSDLYGRKTSLEMKVHFCSSMKTR